MVTIWQGVFEGCTALKYVNFGDSFNYFQNSSSDHFNLFLGCDKLETVVLPAANGLILGNEDSHDDARFTYIFSSGSDNIKFYCTGGYYDLWQLSFVMSYYYPEGNTKFINAEYTEYSAGTDYSKMEGSFIVYNYNRCDAFYGGEHTSVTVSYPNGFGESGTKTCICSRCDLRETTTLDPIFSAFGYSVKSDGTSLYSGFEVNFTALNTYNSCVTNGKELRYGIVISNVNDSTGITFTDGVIDEDKSIQVEVIDRTFTHFGFALNNFGESARAIKLAISLYVIDENGNMTFVQKAPDEGVTDYYLSYLTVDADENKKIGTISFEKVIALNSKNS